MKKILCLIMACALMASIVTGCAPAENAESPAQDTSQTEHATDEEEASEESGEPQELSIFMFSRNIQEGSYAKELLEERTNTKLTIIDTPGYELSNKLNVLLSSGDIPDVIQYTEIPMEGTLLKHEILLPLNEYWDEYPNIKNARSEETWEAMRYTDGNIYAAGIYYPDAKALSIMAYRGDWLDLYEMEVPTTIDEYYAFAQKVAYEDPDGNGVDDTFAFGSYGNVDLGWIDHIFGAYGALPNFWHEKDGELVSGSIQPEMKDALIFLNKMYNEGLIDPEFVTDDVNRWQTKVKSGQFAGGVTKIHMFDENNWLNYYGAFTTANPDGYYVWGDILQGASETPVGSRRDAARGWLRTSIYKDSPNVDAALRLLDYTMSPEGNKFLQYGTEGEHYEMDGDTVVRLIDDDQTNELDLNKFWLANTPLFEHSSAGLQDAFVHTTANTIGDAAEGIFVDEIAEYEAKLKETTNIRYIEMIIGETPIEPGFDDFVAEWNERGGAELTVALNEANK